MKKLLYISFIFTLLLAFGSCEKQVIKPVDNDDPFAMFDENSNNRGFTSGSDDGSGDGDGGGIVDPDENDEDLNDSDGNGIVDPDEGDEDLDDDNGK